MLTSIISLKMLSCTSDEAKGQANANFPLFFALHLATIYGFRLTDDCTEETPYLDLQEGAPLPSTRCIRIFWVCLTVISHLSC